MFRKIILSLVIFVVSSKVFANDNQKLYRLQVGSVKYTDEIVLYRLNNPLKLIYVFNGKKVLNEKPKNVKVHYILTDDNNIKYNFTGQKSKLDIIIEDENIGNKINDDNIGTGIFEINENGLTKNYAENIFK